MRTFGLTVLALVLSVAPAPAQTYDPTCGTCATINGGLQTLQQSQAAQQQIQQNIQDQLNAQAQSIQARTTIVPLQIPFVVPRLLREPPRRAHRTSKVRNTRPAGKPGS